MLIMILNENNVNAKYSIKNNKTDDSPFFLKRINHKNASVKSRINFKLMEIKV